MTVTNAYHLSDILHKITIINIKNKNKAYTENNMPKLCSGAINTQQSK